MLGASTLGDLDTDYANFPAPYNNPDFFYDHLDTRVEFRQFLPKDVLATNAAAGQKVAAFETTIGAVAKMRQELQQSEPGADYDVFIYNDASRYMEDGAIGTNYKAWNFLVPTTSKNTDRTMRYLDWLFSNPDNHDLFELGIEGEHWMKDGDRLYKTTENTKNYTFPVYEMTWNSCVVRDTPSRNFG